MTAEFPFWQCGWLFGLEADQPIFVSTKVLNIRQMRQDEAAYIHDQVAGFALSQSPLLVNSIKRFPYIYERRAVGPSPNTNDPRFAIILALLAEGEIQIPVHWTVAESPNFQMGASASSEIIELLFRFMNGRLHAVPISSIEHPARYLFPKLEPFFTGQLNEVVGLDQVIMERISIAKRSKIDAQDLVGIVNRATEICSALEYLFSESSTSEIVFRLAMSLGWLLERTPVARERVITDLNKAYVLRSKRVHGARITETVREAVPHVRAVDLLLRRAVMVRLLGKYDDQTWVSLFKTARIGGITDDFDRAEWLDPSWRHLSPAQF